MQKIFDEVLEKTKRIRARKTQTVAVLLALSLLVSLNVFWMLRQPGWTLAGDADCGIAEHVHDDSCQNRDSGCGFVEHTHDISCYSNDKADIETQLDWQGMFKNYPYTDDLRKDLAGIAKTQVGYSESEQNFELGDDGVRRGYTRYGAWYGSPYIDWSAAFVSFCLNYAGADAEEAPVNIGAASMAEMWKARDKYAPAGEYRPSEGDLVFLENNSVGIVTETLDSVFYLIRGDVDNTVRREALFFSDKSIIGWGTTVGTVYDNNVKNEAPPTENKPVSPDGPLFDIYEGDAPEIEIPQVRMRAFSLNAQRTITDLLAYLKANGGSYFFTLLDKNNEKLQKDENGHYIVEADKGYNLTISINSPKGFLPGVYQYKTPDGLLVDGGEGTFILKDGANVGDWTVTNDGLITMDFNENINSRTEITISATMGIRFVDQDEPIDFDGKISVTVQKPPEEIEQTKLNKWGTQGVEGDENKPDPSKIYWTVEIQGKEGSDIVGSVITDQIKRGDHKFTQSDIEGGLRFGVGEYDLETGVQKAWHSWVVGPDDPNLEWDENGWTYTIPETAICNWCPTPITLGNDGWIYYVEYTSTPDTEAVTGKVWYTNDVSVDNQYMEGWGNFEHAPSKAGIIKNGSFHGDAEGGTFLWEFKAVVPGMAENEKAVYLWQILDSLRVKDTNGDTIGFIQNDSDKSRVTATNNGNTVDVPHVSDVTAADKYAWNNMWSSDHGGVFYSRALVLLCRCNCTEQNCQFWGNGACGSAYWYQDDYGDWHTNGMCYCWTETEDTVFNFFYQTDDTSVIENYGGQGYYLQNEALLQNTVYGPDGTASTVGFGSAVADVPIPGMFKKELVKDFDGYVAHYQITVNEGKLALTDGTPITIHDVMTETLTYISGSMVITAEDVDGNTTLLEQGVDYEITYDGTGNVKDAYGNPVHVIDIVILRPQPVMYILDYDTTLIIPVGVTEAVKYTNSASITVWGRQITDTTVEKVYADINIAAKNYHVEMFKLCAETGKPLPGAKFGLFNENGGIIATDVTDVNGKLDFKTDIINGIILREHELYYIQELDAPPGYLLDDKKYWFCFCNETTSSCERCDEVSNGLDALRIPFEQIGKIHVVNQFNNYDLPATGGSGVYPLMLASVVFIVTPLVYRFIRWRKRERRSIG